jgi:signal transduction histidine kinase
MPQWLSDILEQGDAFMPHGHCYLWLPGVLWMHVISDFLIGVAYIGISFILYLLVRRIRLPFSPVFIAFGLFIALCGMTHFMSIWTVWHPDYVLDGLVKSATALASVATAIGLVFIRPQVEEVVHAARLSEERRIRLESAHAELEALYSKVKQLDEAKTQFFANISHELRTPLTLILGPAERLLEKDALSPEQRRQITSIARNGKSLLKQVNDLLDVAKLEAGHMKAHYTRFDLVPWVRHLASQYDVAADERRIHFQIDTPSALIVEADPDMLERTIGNLLSNAFKFVPSDGAIAVTLTGSDKRIRIAVSDTGPGIGEEQQSMIFERFRQGDGGATRRHGGTGLGLAIAKEFVELHGGRIEVESAPGKGALFTVELPALAPPDEQVEEHRDAVLQHDRVLSAPDLAADPEHPHVPFVPGLPNALVVEDNIELRVFICETLEGICNVITASDGKEGLERAQALLPDVIITDIMMPRMSGDELVQALRRDKQFDPVPLLLLSAKSDDEQRVALLQSGAQDYLTKPFLPQELRARIKNLLAIKLATDALREELKDASGDIVKLARDLAVRSRQLQVALDVADVAREQAERANAVKSDFLGLISHEMRTPLTTIQLNADLAARAQEMSASGQPRQPMERMLRAVHQLTALVEGILYYARADSGRLNIHPENFDLGMLVENIVKDHRPGVPDTVELVLEAPEPGLPMLECDARLLRVIVGNLLSNAIKFTRQGTVTISTGVGGSQHFIEVADTGIGIPQADLDRIFEPFAQLEPVRRKSIPGVGLGLALVKEITNTLGGEVEVTSTPGNGSRFIIRLPSRMDKLHKAA